MNPKEDWRAIENRIKDHGRSGSLKRSLADQDFVKHHTEGPKIRSGID